MAETPMMQQYTRMKEKHGDCILFFRLGDFYEMFGADARLASSELDLVLTTRDKKSPADERIPMCGVPYHSAEGYIARLIAKGFKVAICEQTEDPKNAKGLVDRDVVRIITPGTAISASMLDERRNNFLAVVVRSESGAGVAFCDVTTGELYAARIGRAESSAIRNELARYQPAEALFFGCDAALCDWARSTLGAHVETSRAEPERPDFIIAKQFGETAEKLNLDAESARATAALLAYLYETQKTAIDGVRHIEIYTASRFMELDAVARRNLELCVTLRTGEKRGSLLWALDRTITPMGGRLIRSWLEKPLRDPVEIMNRHAAVEKLAADVDVRSTIRQELREVSDIERISSRVCMGAANARDLRALADTSRHLAPLRALAERADCSLMHVIAENIDPLDDLCEHIDRAICDEPPFSIREGGFIRDGYNAEVDRLRDVQGGGKGAVAAIEQQEREQTGIRSLKIGYNRVFGYYIEVRKTSDTLVPSRYVRKQTLSDRERYITDELKELESTILTAGERLSALEGELFEQLRASIASEILRIQRTARAVAATDALQSFAETAVLENYTRPTVDDGDTITITDGRHPVVEKMITGGLFVPNDTLLDCRDNTALIITGPNMAGKSTYMRQVALITLMAQAGSFVPARSAHIGVCDRIFTRIGASDDLAGGASTFMVEMSEVAETLRSATAKSLIILDEVGRGTSTFDGMAIARAVLEHICKKGRHRAKTLFATHYHELTALEDELQGVKNYNIAAKKRGDDIIFLRKIVRGGADDSYGIEVARLAGVPDSVTRRAREILVELEQRGFVQRIIKPKEDSDDQISMASLGGSELVEALKTLDLNVLTPIEAMNKLYELKQKAGTL